MTQYWSSFSSISLPTAQGNVYACTVRSPLIGWSITNGGQVLMILQNARMYLHIFLKASQIFFLFCISLSVAFLNLWNDPPPQKKRPNTLIKFFIIIYNRWFNKALFLSFREIHLRIIHWPLIFIPLSCVCPVYNWVHHVTLIKIIAWCT